MSATKSPYALPADTRLADAIARADALGAEIATLQAEIERLRQRLGHDVRTQAGLSERRRQRWATP